MEHPKLNLKGFTFQELFDPQDLHRLDQDFLRYLESINPTVLQQLHAYRAGQIKAPTEVSRFILECGPILETFVAELFGIENAAIDLCNAIRAEDPIFEFKKHYVLKLAKRALHHLDIKIDFTELDQWLNQQLQQNKLTIQDRELAVAQLGLRWLTQELQHQNEIERLTQWCVAAMTSEVGQQQVKSWMSFKLPNKLNYENLVETQPLPNDSLGRLEGPPHQHRMREGFQLTDPRMTRREVLNEIHYCVYCHKTDGDFCSKGFPVKKNEPAMGFKINPVGETLTGCPLEQKISEMHTLKKEGYSIAALATVTIDNPMCAVTGHRICNDCMKGCIYQKQDPVNIPQAETRILTDVLNLPWGVEIYDLLIRWNPLRAQQWLPDPYNGLKVLVMGMGPAGFTLAHYLLMEGFAVVGAEGLKIEPLPQALISQPIYRYQDIQENLNDRVMTGFGGVAEYGITVRWDKNFLKLIYLSLMRRPYFQVFGGIRFGGTLTIENAWALGFDHLVVAVGAGLPRELRIPNSLAPGMRQANDFLMALQLTGAAKKTSLANLQVRLPAVVIGGGLTGIDTATEVQVYYVAQVEKIYARYKKLIARYGESAIRNNFMPHDLEILDESIAHAEAILQERQEAQREQRPANFLKLIRQWGGVTVTYRRTMQESPAYKRNHEEVMNAMNEGIYYAEGLEPKAVVLDKWGSVQALRCQWRVMDEVGNWMFTDEEQTVAANAIFVATGAKPNIAYEFEHRGTFERNGFEYQRFDLEDHTLKLVSEMGHVKTPDFGPFTSYAHEHRRVTFIGDTHPVFHGSVVKAMASAKRTYPHVVMSLQNKMSKGDLKEYSQFRHHIQHLFAATLEAMVRLNDQVIELKVRAPLAAQNFQPGQFYRLQNYERSAPIVEGTALQIEALALNGIYREHEPDMLTFIVFENGVSSRLVATLKVGQPLSLMGPTGARSKVFKEPHTILVMGDATAAVQLLSYAPSLRKAGCRVFFIGSYRHVDELFCREEIEACTDAIVWITREGPAIPTNRGQDFSAQGEIIDVIGESAKLGKGMSLQDVDHVMVVGPSHLLRSVENARKTIFQALFKSTVTFEGSVYGPMQCMLKGVCAQCLQWQIDPKTGERTKAVYACSWQNQPIEMIDTHNINERLGQNRMQETLSNLWLDYLFEKHSVERI